MKDLDELERLAKAATPGPWAVRKHTALIHSDTGLSFDIVELGPTGDETSPNLAFIAACSPDVVLALVRAVRAAAVAAAFAEMCDPDDEHSCPRDSCKSMLALKEALAALEKS